jgi:DNA-directed RNA polymerase specialized sigma24 family protein
MSVATPERAQNAEAMERLFRRHRGWLLDFLNRRFGPLVGEDLVQEAFARALASGSEVRHPRAFLAKVAIRAALEEVRRRPDLGMTYQPPPAVAADAEQAMLLEQAILSLPGPIRDVFVLSRFGGLTNGVRARAQEVAHELLGDLSRTEAERRIWRETRADRFTGFDRRLLRAADEERLVEDGLGAGGAWAALTRGRLRHLEALGLATRAGPRYRLDPALETRLRALQLGQDMLRLRQQHRLETGQDICELGQDRVRGKVVSRGVHDELGAVAWVIVRDSSGLEHYARLGFGQTTPRLGRTVDLAGTGQGAVILQNQRGRSQQRGDELGR